MKGKKVLSLLLAIIMIIGILPLDRISYAQNGFEVKKINIYRTYEGLSDTGTYGISVTGTGLSKVNIMYKPDASDTFIPLTNPSPGSDDYFRQYRIDPGIIISQIRVGNQVFDINETSMPKVTEIDPKQVDLNSDDPKVTIKGENFGKIDDDTSITISNILVTEDFKGKTSGVTLDKAALLKLQHGIKHIVIERKNTVDGVDITTTYNQRNAFRIYESIKIDEKKDVTIFPNRGKVGTEVTITIANNEEDFSVFFLEDETKPFLYKNMGEEPYYPQTTDKNGIIKVKVPKGLSTGQTYKVVITNNLDNVKKPDMDLTNLVTKQKNIGEFYVVDANVGPSIAKVTPNEGTSAGSYVTIYGYRFEELKMNGLIGEINGVTDDELEILKGGADDPTKLRIEYKYDEGLKYNDSSVNSITRDFLVTIGRDAIFEDDHKAKNIFKEGDNQEDQLYVRTKTIDGEDLKDPVKDVVIEITTTITTTDGEFVFTEVAILPKGYTFLPSHQDPTIEKVTPDKIQVISESSPSTKKDTILSIQGKNFNVFRYRENGEFKTNYPKVVIGGSGEDSGQIIIERKEDGNIYYGSTSDRDADGNVNFIKIEGAIFEVLDKNGNIITGVGGNEVGDSIVVTMPRGLNVSANILNKPQPIAVANPKRDSKDRGIYSFKNDIISFVTVTSDPIIEKVDPYIVTVEGGEEIIIEGRNFQDGIKVFIDGKEIQNVTRDIDKQTTRGTLKFKAPKGREGDNILQVMNPDGGSDIHQFIYVQTMKIDPKITSIAPNKGTKDTLVVIKGDNFLKPDQTVKDISGLGLHKLIGTRVFLGKDDVNTYNSEGLIGYSVPEVKNQLLLDVKKDDWTKKDKLILSPYYKSATIKDSGDNPYSIYVDYEGNPVLAGKDKIYTFKLVGNSIKATDNSGQNHDVTVKIGEMEVGTTKFKVSFDYKLISVGENEFGTKYLRVAEYYDSLILENNNVFYILEVDEMDKVTLSDGKDDIYEIKLNTENEIIATKGSQDFKVEMDGSYIKIGSQSFNLKTPYYINPDTKVITGHRAKVKNKNEIWITIPERTISGFYDVTVRNPDTKSDTVKNGFEYLIPQSKPTINYITPSQGSVDGGYEIVIFGEGFEDTTEVYISGAKIVEKDVKVNKEDYRSITVSVPKYPGDTSTDFVTDKKFVPVVVLNEDGGSASREDLFAYVIASSRPRIDRINPAKGSAAGGEVIEIWGYDFRFFEPYKGEMPKEGDKNYEDLDRDGKWTNMKSDRDCPKKPLDHPVFSEYCYSPILPKIFFGNEEARIVEFKEGYVKVIAPRSYTQGAVDVYVLNNDAGTSNKVKFTFEGSNPTINSIVPDTGRKQGGEWIDIMGSNFKQSNIKLYDKDKKEETVTTYIVRFGEISNRQIPRENENSGLINVGRATVNLAGGLKVEYKLEDGEPKIELILEEGSKVYKGEYPYNSREKYIDVKGLKDKDNMNYNGFELIKIEVRDGRLLVDRGYSSEVRQTFRDHLEVLTPSYYSIGNVNVVVENPDGVSNKANFVYKNPDSQPVITNITRDEQQPQIGDNGDKKILQINYRSGSIVTVYGKDFRKEVKVQIGDFVTINSEDIIEMTSEKITFVMPEVDENKAKMLYSLVVINSDGGTSSSAQTKPLPIYIEITTGESDPGASNIEPSKGPATGGTKVTITGSDFRDKVEGYEGEKLKVFFGEFQVDERYIKRIDSETLEVTTPKSTRLGPVQVRIENPDGSISQGSITFTYISKPKIDKVSPNKIFMNDTQTEVTLTGEMFQSGAKVIVGGKIVDKKDLKQDMEIMGEGIIGVDSQGNNREVAVVGGIETATTKVESDNTIKVTFKEGTDLENNHLIIINPDGGISEPYDKFEYQNPVPTKPLVLEGIPGYESTVQLIWSKSDENILNKATRYEIYGKLSKDKDYTFIGDTAEAGFLVKGLELQTEYIFMVRALNEYGAAIDFATVKVKTLNLREDKKLKEKEEKLKEKEKEIQEKGKEEIVNGRVIRIVGADTLRGGAGTIDLSLAKYKNHNKFTVSIPIQYARKDNILTIKDGTMTTIINAKDLYTLAVSKKDNGNKDGYVNIHIDRVKETHIPRGKRISSRAYNITFDYQYGKDILEINNLLRAGKVIFEQDKVTYPSTKNTKLYRFNQPTGQYVSTGATSTSIKENGKYILLSDR